MDIEKIIKEHNQLIKKIMKEFNTTKIISEKALDIACDYNINNEEQLFEILYVIINTINRLIKDEIISENELEIKTGEL
jgi:hypothetical protein